MKYSDSVLNIIGYNKGVFGSHMGIEIDMGIKYLVRIMSFVEVKLS